MAWQPLRRALFALVIVGAGCSSDSQGRDVGVAGDLSLPAHDLSIVDATAQPSPDLVAPPPDLSVLADLSRPADLATSVDSGASCVTINQAAQTFIDTHVACKVDADCVLEVTRCGMPGQCGAYLQAIALPGLQLLEQQFDAAHCMGPCPPCVAPLMPACVQNRCTGM